MLKGKKITVGITGGIAAYKAAELVSGLVQNGTVVNVIMTDAARQFVQPLTFATLAGNAVYTSMFDERYTGEITHLDLAQKADLLVIVPATANIIAKAAHGIADDLLSTVILATGGLVMICPAMNTVMYNNPVVQQNIAKLRQLGYYFVGPASGSLACGTSGLGRMKAPQEILQAIKQIFTGGDLAGVKVLISAGPTLEPLDPVRYIANRSSGKMGYHLAEVAMERGGEVILVSGPVQLPAPAGVQLVKVETARQMHQAIIENFNAVDVVIKAAAVTDYRPKQIAAEKIKKNEDQLLLSLQKNPDILAELGQLKQHQILVGFAAETNNLEQYAQAKLKNKNLDLLVANNVSMPGAGFDVDTNIVKIFCQNGTVTELPLMSKRAVASRILDLVVRCRNEQSEQ